MKTEANVEQAVPFFAVSDMDASLRFYIDGLGFEMKIYRDVTSRGIQAKKPFVGNRMWVTEMSEETVYSE